MRTFAQQLVALSVGVGLLLAVGPSEAGPLYRWTDADGRLWFGSQPPPDQAEVNKLPVRVTFATHAEGSATLPQRRAVVPPRRDDANLPQPGEPVMILALEGEFAGVHWDRADLAGAQFAWADMGRASLGESQLAGVSMFKADLGSAVLDGANLEGANLMYANLKRGDLRGARLPRARLNDANLKYAEAAATDFRQGDLARTDGFRADFAGADFQGAWLTAMYLFEANLDGADLRGADLTGAYLVDADFRDADLRGARLLNVRTEGADFTGAAMEGAIILEADDPTWRRSAPVLRSPAWYVQQRIARELKKERHVRSRAEAPARRARARLQRAEIQREQRACQGAFRFGQRPRGGNCGEVGVRSIQVGG